MKHCRIALSVGMVFLIVAVCWSAVGMMSVQVKNGQIRVSPSFLAKVVAPVAYGDRVEVTQQSGDWMEVVKSGSQKGWIHQSALTQKQISLGAGGQNAQVGASGQEIALAGKGFNADVEARYRSGHRDADFTWVDRMETIWVSPEEMIAFLREGNVSAGKGGVK